MIIALWPVQFLAERRDFWSQCVYPCHGNLFHQFIYPSWLCLMPFWIRVPSWKPQHPGWEGGWGDIIFMTYRVFPSLSYEMNGKETNLQLLAVAFPEFTQKAASGWLIKQGKMFPPKYHLAKCTDLLVLRHFINPFRFCEYVWHLALSLTFFPCLPRNHYIQLRYT